MKVDTVQRSAGAVIGMVLALATGPAIAQQASSYTDLSQYLVSPSASAAPAPVSGILASTIVQNGQNNYAAATLAGSGNLTTQYQAGFSNSSTLAISGRQNAISNTQIGNSNTAAISINGSSNSISNVQVGNNLSYQLSVVGTSAPVSVQQYGNGKR